MKTFVYFALAISAIIINSVSADSEFYELFGRLFEN